MHIVYTVNFTVSITRIVANVIMFAFYKSEREHCMMATEFSTNTDTNLNYGK